MQHAERLFGELRVEGLDHHVGAAEVLVRHVVVDDGDRAHARHEGGLHAVAAAGHNVDEGSVTTAATCTADGVMTYTCTACGNTTTEVIPATGHRYTTLSEKAATCTEAGLYRGVCDVCAQEIDERYDPLGHSDETVKDGLMSVTVRCTLCQREEKIDKPFAESALPFILVGILLMLIPVCVIGAMLYTRKRRQKEEELRRRRFTEEE